MEKYRSCHSVEGELFFNHLNKVGYCSMLTPDGGQPTLYENYHGELIDWDEFFRIRDEHIELMKNGSCVEACKGCTWIREWDWKKREKRFNYILLNPWIKCNLRCIYCMNHNDVYLNENTKEYNLLPVLTDMIEKGVIDKDTRLDFAGGESTLDKNFDAILNLFIDAGVKNININSNCTIYSDSIKRGLEKGSISVITSVDSGNRKTFEKIKQVDLWNTFWKNVKKYTSVLSKENGNSFKTKFIIVPGVNDTKKQIFDFLLKSKKYNVSGTILNIDLHWIRLNDSDVKGMKKIIKLTRYYIKLSKLFNIDFFISAHIEDLIKRHNMHCENDKVDIDFIFEKFVPHKNFFLNFISNFLSLFYL